jgi:hypothetical protein
MNPARRGVVALLGALALASGRAATPDFVADPAVAQAMQAAAAEAVTDARNRLHLQLDYSEASMDDVERLLDSEHLSRALASRLMPDAQLTHVAETFGAYFGEVYRRNRGAAWGRVTLNGNTYPGFRTDSGVNVWATGRVLNRIIDGPDNNIAEYYRKLVRGPAKD